MRKVDRQRLLYESRKARTNFLRQIRRDKIKQESKRGWSKYVNDMRNTAQKKGTLFIEPSMFDFRRNIRKVNAPAPSETIQFWNSKNSLFSNKKELDLNDCQFTVPKVFSLNKNGPESFSFLKRLYLRLKNQDCERIIIDYGLCESIDLDASVCMDVILREFIEYFKRCKRNSYPVKVLEITPVNYRKEEVRKILFAIGAFSNIRNFTIKYPDIIQYPLCIANSRSAKASAIREVHITAMVEYVIKCMAKMNRELTAEAEKNLFTVIGEVLINAEEHSTQKMRYSIGYFKDSIQNGEHVGIFNLVILNFGDSIYEKFKDPECANDAVIKQMEGLSSSYTSKGLFSKAEFEEETLWTLYALQQGVTSKSDWRRGNGSIAFIESFFNLKGSQENDSQSYLSILSGNTRIIFDGSYRIKEVVKGMSKKTYKMMTFNEEGSIEKKPDKNFVTFVDNYFPGTMISASICIKEDNSQKVENERA